MLEEMIKQLCIKEYFKTTKTQFKPCLLSVLINDMKTKHLKEILIMNQSWLDSQIYSKHTCENLSKIIPWMSAFWMIPALHCYYWLSYAYNVMHTKTKVILQIILLT